MPVGSAFSGAYNSFSGVDVKAVFGEVVIAEIQAISYSISREKAPIYTMGSADPRSYSRGKRGIAGTLIFIVFDRHALLGALGMMAENQAAIPLFLSDVDDLRPGFLPGAASPTLVVDTGSAREVSSPVQMQESSLTEDNVTGDQLPALPWYADQIPPFDITLAAANEYGALAVMRIFGAEILNEGFGISVDDIQAAQQFTYVARQVIGWKPVKKEFPGLPG